MKRIPSLLFPGWATLWGALAATAVRCPADHHQNFAVAIYIPVQVTRSFAKPDRLQRDWETISRQLQVDKVYIESQRDRMLADDDLLENVKRFFLDHGVRVAGGMALSDLNMGQFRSFCYTNPADREFIRGAVATAARHFDEVILDDFFFVTTKDESDIAAKGNRSWTEFRLALMDEAAENLILKTAKTANPRVKLVIKFPNWYEHFQGLGYDLDRESKMFAGIYTGTETRDPVATDQFLQQYESFQIMRYFENIKPGGNGGGWVDTFSVDYVDRYAEQLWNTLFAKAREITLFNWSALLEPITPGNRTAWRARQTSFALDQILPLPWFSPPPDQPPTMARVAAYSLDQVDAFLGKLGRPIGVPGYKPYQSSSREDFLYDYFGMLGIPIDLHPTFPAEAGLVLLTEAAKFDPAIVSRIKGQLLAGKSVVITSGLLRALQGKGIEDIVEAECTEARVLAQDFTSGFGAGDHAGVEGSPDRPAILFPQIRFLTNDAWSLVNALGYNHGYPVLLMDRYAKGVLYVWTIPDNFPDLYRLPPAVTTAIKDVVLTGFPVRLDGPSQVALFAYDNRTFIVESYLDHDTDVRISVTGGAAKLLDLVSGATTAPSPSLEKRWPWSVPSEPRAEFYLHLPPHSYRVLAAQP